MDYCDHGSLGAQIKQNCPSTCGSNGCPKLCAYNPSGPGYTGYTCDSIKSYCNHGSYGPKIRSRCPKSCGVCS